ncbi:MAG: hypothetical protein D4R83_02030 [Streptomycetaceae bacterium]|nr:MAG: hypothetical protein D4R83_02030 [Streptomycetaceae bacterium]
MKEDDFFSIEQSEELIASLKNGTQSEFSHLQSSLKVLAHVEDLPKGATPPVLPSSIKEILYKMPVEFSKRRTAVVSLIAASLVASATLTAAAVTNSGPAPLVKVAHQTAKFVKEIAGTVTKAVTGRAKDLNETPSAPASAPASATPTAPASATPTAPASATPTAPAPVVVAPTKPAKKESEKQKNPESSKGNDESKSPSTGLTPPPVTGGGDESNDHGTTSDDSFDDEGDHSPGSSHDSEDDDSEEEDD